MCFLSAPSAPPIPAPPPLLPAPSPGATDPAARRAREEQKRRAAAMAGYASTIATSGLGVTAPAPLTTASSAPASSGRSGAKALLGQ